MNIKKDDKVVVLSGKDKGVKGKVLTAMSLPDRTITVSFFLMFISSVPP